MGPHVVDMGVGLVRWTTPVGGRGFFHSRTRPGSDLLFHRRRAAGHPVDARRTAPGFHRIVDSSGDKMVGTEMAIPFAPTARRCEVDHHRIFDDLRRGIPLVAAAIGESTRRPPDADPPAIGGFNSTCDCVATVSRQRKSVEVAGAATAAMPRRRGQSTAPESIRATWEHEMRSDHNSPRVPGDQWCRQATTIACGLPCRLDFSV